MEYVQDVLHYYFCDIPIDLHGDRLQCRFPIYFSLPINTVVIVSTTYLLASVPHQQCHTHAKTVNLTVNRNVVCDKKKC